jgi:hypothetical protein
MFVLVKTAPRRWVTPCAALFISAVSLAQTADTNPRSNTDDLKAIRASLERLVQLTQANLAVQQMQLYESRLQALETRDDVLNQRESDLSARSAELQRAVRDTESGASAATGVPGASSSPAVRTEIAAQLEANLRQLDSTRSRKKQIEREMASLRSRIESLQKDLVAAGVER